MLPLRAPAASQPALHRAYTLSYFDEAESDVGRSNSDLGDSRNLFDRFQVTVDPILKKYHDFVHSVSNPPDNSPSDEELKSFLQCIDANLPLWRAKKEAFLQRQEKSFIRSVEYDPTTETLYAHREEGKVLGKGSFAVVTESYVVETGLKLAFKIYRSVPEAPLSREEMEEMRREGHKHFALKDCPHVVRAYCVNVRGLLLEHMARGSLQKLLEENYEFSDEELATIAQDAIAGMHEIHSKGFVHKDIKLDNVYVNEAGVAKIGDLGTASPINQLMRANRGNPLSWSPQIWKSWVEGKPHASCPKDDVWAMGMLLYELDRGLHVAPSFVEVLPELMDVCAARDDCRKKERNEATGVELEALQAKAYALYQKFLEDVKIFEESWEKEDGGLALLEQQMLRGNPDLRISSAQAVMMANDLLSAAPLSDS